MRNNLIYIGTIALLLGCSQLRLHAGLFLNAADLAESVPYGMTPIFQSVGQMRVIGPGGEGSFGSGVLISPNWVLASGHQFGALGYPGVTNNRFVFGGNGLSPTESSFIEAEYVYPGYNPNVVGGPDLALFRLATPILTIEPAARYRGNDNVLIGSFTDNSPPTYMAGFGTHGVVGDSNLVRGDLRRGGTNFIERVDETHLFTTSETFEANYLTWKGTPGDSGGGWFHEIDGQIQLVGISSYVGLPYNGWSYTAATRVSIHNEWIESTITAVPEPSTSALVAIGAIMLIKRRRRANKAMDLSRGSAVT